MQFYLSFHTGIVTDDFNSYDSPVISSHSPVLQTVQHLPADLYSAHYDPIMKHNSKLEEYLSSIYQLLFCCFVL
jgi:hypothetical protein